MKIAIFSDTHDNIPNIERALSWISKEKIFSVVHCGDVCLNGTLNYLAKNFSGLIHLSLGNADQIKGSWKNVVVHKKWGELIFEGKKIAFTHFPEEAKELANRKKYDLVFHGHTHRPWERKIGGCRAVNPGNLAGLFYKATFAVYDTANGKLELKILERLLTV